MYFYNNCALIWALFFFLSIFCRVYLNQVIEIKDDRFILLLEQDDCFIKKIENFHGVTQ